MSKVQDLNLTFSGCGFLGIYHIGVMSCLKQNATSLLGRVKCFGGASAGAFAAVGLVMNLDVSDIVESVLRLGKRANSLSLGPFHPSFQIVKTVRKAFDQMLPDNAHEIATGRLHISLSQVTLTGFKNVIISEFYSKEDLIEALVASSYVPVFSGMFPAVYRGKYYVDGGISDNLPQHFKEGETITVSPFSGEHDICPKDVSSNEFHIELRNTSMQFTGSNIWRLSHALWPPSQEVLIDICRQGYRDTLRFLTEHYPDTLMLESLTTASMVFDILPLHSSSPSYCQGSSIIQGASQSSDLSFNDNNLSCDYKETGLCLAPGSHWAETELEEGESKLSMILLDANKSATEAELWSCYFLRKSCHILDLLARPCIITFKQILVMLKIILQALIKIEKTGCKYFDNMLSVVSTMLQTYEDKHQVTIHWKSKSFMNLTEESTDVGESSLILYDQTQKVISDAMEGLSTVYQNEPSILVNEFQEGFDENMDATEHPVDNS
ncbi:patatin-like phospholipase domain-containing protein 3 [Stylophora pistillata]|uniref:Patatin-like phospholipase domain-containing protein 2 n=1 Tax=Stylophora pistillata TaxID=50429 RepID=A0A2B4SGW9_STYPI|nr:patatin-like phospholipase domain-containing protein 3 [Stylophora pistillata]PFX28606.1 Patatin-like phospholipase domain-containing protein 2 [Stylophora pistillata]